MQTPLLVTLVLSSTSLVAQSQTTVVPSIYANAEANSSTAYPFGLTATSRVQYLYTSSLVAVPAMSIKQLATRNSNASTSVAKQIDLEVGMTTTTTDWLASSTTFATNLGTDYKIVFTRKLINLPAQVATTPAPAPFTAIVPFDSQFLYLTANGNLLIDYFQHAVSTGAYNHDTSFTQTGVFTANGTSCGNLSQTGSGGTASTLTSTATFAFTGAPIGGVAIHALGSQLLPSPLPLPFGGCLLYQDILATTPVTISATGTGSMVYPLSPNWKNVTVYGQFVALDTTVPALSASQSHKLVIGGFDPHTRIYNLTSDTSPTGSIQLGVGIVTELTY